MMLFSELDQLWGPFTVDCFAIQYNERVPKIFFLDFGILGQPD